MAVDGNVVTAPRWWGSFDFDSGAGRRWQIGPLSLVVFRMQGEWRVVTHNSGDRQDDSLLVNVPVEPEEALDLEGEVTRLAARPEEMTLELRPALADRSMVIRTESPFRLPRESEITFYTSTPLWVCVMAGKLGDPLFELPTWRPSDTWFGPTTTEGELCYASRTAGRLNAAELPLRPYRAVTAVSVRNDAETTLPIDRMLIPVQHLSLFVRADGYLETQPVTLSRSSSAEASFEVSRLAQMNVTGKARVSGPREKLPERGLARALTSFVLGG